MGLANGNPADWEQGCFIVAGGVTSEEYAAVFILSATLQPVFSNRRMSLKAAKG
ncbi:MAG: hypothetical protein WCA21_13295 [Terracidiphilus sp.]